MKCRTRNNARGVCRITVPTTAPLVCVLCLLVVTRTISMRVRLIESFGHIDEQEKAYLAGLETTGYAFCSCAAFPLATLNRETGRSRLAEPGQHEALDRSWNPDRWQTPNPQVECDLEHNH